MENTEIFPKIANYCQILKQEFDLISAERKESLQEIADFIIQKQKAKASAELTIICTHNSRRSHIGQVWLKVAATYYGIQEIKTYSGGTDATAFNPRAIAAFERIGFEVLKSNEEKNPKYDLSYGKDLAIKQMFSKKYDHEANPNKDFCAVMVCSEADEACPMVKGASKRVSLPFEDPKKFDGTALEASKYDERCRQIAREMFWVMEQVSKSK